MQVVGWAAEENAGAPAHTIEIDLDGSRLGLATRRQDRPDVARELARLEFASSGWTGELRLGAVAPGEHRLTARACDASGSCSPLRGEARFIVSPNAPPVGAVEAAQGPSGTSSVPQSGWLTATGWAGDDDGAVRRVELLIDDAVAGEAVLGLRRPDLPADARPGHAGWHVDLNVRDLAEGSHRLTARAYDNVGGSLLLDRSASILVTRNRGAPEGAVESIRDAATGAAGPVPQYGVLRIDGWAIDEEQGAPVDRVIVSLDGEPRTAASLDFPLTRIDPVARANGNLDAPPPDASGATRAALSQHGRWSAWLDVGAASPGRHQVTVAAFDSGGKTTPLGPGLTVEVTRAPPPGAARLASAIQPPPLSRDPPFSDEYIWSEHPGSRDVVRYFRRRFVIDRVPPAATLMVSGPDVLDVFVNGERVAREAGFIRDRARPPAHR